jgi:uncharacterized membrane protein
LSQHVLAERWRRATLALFVVLIVLILAWWQHATDDGNLLVTTVSIAPLLAPLRGIVRHDRPTYAWATLCVIPYFVVGITETIANPHARAWPAACLLLSLALFVTLIGYLRVTREEVKP